MNNLRTEKGDASYADGDENADWMRTVENVRKSDGIWFDDKDEIKELKAQLKP